MKNSLPLVLALIFALLPVRWAGAQEPPTFAETTHVVVVEIPVNVVADNQSVRGLTAADFEVFEGRQRQELSGFEVVDLMPAQEEKAAVEVMPTPVEGRRRFLLLYDLSHTDPEDLARSVGAARDLIASGLHPTDLVAVAVASASYGVELLLGFTPDHHQVAPVLDVLERLFNRDLEALRQAPPGGKTDALALVAGRVPELVAEIARAEGLAQNVPEEILRWGYFGRGTLGALEASTFVQTSLAERAAGYERQRSVLRRFSQSVAEFAQLTGRLEGRKHLVYFSQGFDNSLMKLEVGGRDVESSFSASGTLNDLNRMIKQLRRAGWTIHTIDPTRIGGYSGQESLTFLALETGGEVYRNFNHLGTAMEAMLEKTSVTYLLSYHARGIAADGAFHPYRVRLRGGPRGARLLHPPGYFAPRPLAEQAEIETALQDGELILRGEPGGEIEAAALVAAFKGPAAEPRVTVWIEAAGQSLLADHPGDRLEVAAFGYAFDAEGKIHGFFSQRMPLDLAHSRKTLEHGSVKFYSELALAPGRYQLRLLVRVAETGRYALRVAEVTVPDLSGSDLVLLPPFILDDPRRAVVIREAAGETSREEAAARYPFKIAGRDFLPAVYPTLAPGQPARVCLMAYNLDSQRMLLDADLVRGDGRPAGDGRVVVVAQGEVAEDGLGQLYFHLDPQGLEPGDYTLEVGITDPATETTHSETAAFRIAARGL